MKGIFISQAVLNSSNGGGQFVKSLIGLLRKAIGVDNLTIVSLPDENDTKEYHRSEKNLIIFDDNPSKMQMAVNVLNKCPRWVKKSIFDEIMEMIKKGDYDFVFLGFSTYEYLIKRIKKETSLPVFVMYQGITPNTKKAKLKNASLVKKIKSIPSYLLVKNRERANAMLSDCNIVHNKRERDVFYSYYKKEPDMFLPVFIADKFELDYGNNPGYQGFSLLFIGSKFGPNLSGLEWFVDNVMSKVDYDIHLYIVGQGMDFLKDENKYCTDNIHVIGEVESLAPWYHFADLVVEPIFEGDGMKTKTVEAMMYGKTILGADEAFCGYEGLDEYRCNTAEEFINKINFYKNSGVDLVNQNVRNIYQKKYSDNAVINMVKEKIMELCSKGTSRTENNI